MDHSYSVDTALTEDDSGGTDSHSMELLIQDTYLRNSGFVRKKVEGDGNCLFRSISVPLFGEENSHLVLRTTAINFMRVNLDIFRDFFHPDDSVVDINQHMLQEIERLSEDGVYAGQECVVALSMALGVNIFVIHGGSQADPRVFTIQHHSNEPCDKNVHIIFSTLGGGHYDAVVDKKDTEETNDLPVMSDNKIKPSDRIFEWKETKFSSLYLLETLPCLTKWTISTATNTVVPCRPLGFRCDICQKDYHTNSSLKRHKIKFHPELKTSFKTRVKYNKCLIPSCDQEFRTVKAVLNHLESFHAAVIKKSGFTFESFEEFKSWKEKEELKNHVFYMKQRKETYGKDTITYQFVCNRNGFKRSASQHDDSSPKSRKRKDNAKGSCKINAICPSRMWVNMSRDNGNVQVQYIETHSHEVDPEQTKYLPIPKKVKDDISKTLQEGIPVDTILDDIQNNIGILSDRNIKMEDIQNCQLINRQKLKEMKRKLIDSKYQKHENDETSTLLWIQELNSSLVESPVLIYKPQGVTDLSRSLRQEDFMLVLMTGDQANVYNKFGGRIIYLDSKHKTNYYNFSILTLLVLDDYHKAYPVSFCITNRQDETALKTFLNAVKVRCPTAIIPILLTDEEATVINSARSVFGSGLQYFVPVSSVQSSWRHKLLAAQTENHQVDMLQDLCNMQNAKTEADFVQHYYSFAEKYAELEPALFQYFQTNYLSHPEKWSLHKVPADLHVEIGTVQFATDLCNKLKHVFLEKKQNRRIDKLIYVLLNIAKDYHTQSTRNTTENTVDDSDQPQGSHRHKAGMEIPDTSIEKINENQFILHLSTGSTSYHTITRYSGSCDQQLCVNKCHTSPCAGVCGHMYSCSCSDYNSLCKHIHKVHSLIDMSSTVMLTCELNQAEIDDEPVLPSSIDEQSQLIERYHRAKDIINSQLEDPTIRPFVLESVVLSLENLIKMNQTAEISLLELPQNIDQSN